MEYSKKIETIFIENGIRVSLDSRNERLQKKIRDAEVEKTPYMIIIGEKEAAGGVLSIRSKAQGDMGIMTSEEFIQMINKEIKEKVR